MYTNEWMYTIFLAEEIGVFHRNHDGARYVKRLLHCVFLDHRQPRLLDHLFDMILLNIMRGFLKAPEMTLRLIGQMERQARLEFDHVYRAEARLSDFGFFQRDERVLATATRLEEANEALRDWMPEGQSTS